MPCDAGPLLKTLSEVALKGGSREALAQALVAALKESFPAASWAGIYWLEGEELVLGPFVGPPSEHVRIPVGRGVCGAAVLQDEDQRVDDVRQRPDYLACSPKVKSEIVVLIRCAGRVVGQLDLDSERLAAFGPEDHCVLKVVADSFGGLLAGPAPATVPDAPPR